MKAFVLEGRGKVSFIEKEEPKLLEEHGVLITPVLVSPCTSDVHTIWQGSPKRKAVPPSAHWDRRWILSRFWKMRRLSKRI